MLEPLPETAEALAEFVSLEEPQLDDSLVYLGERAHELVPELIGPSLGMVREGVTFTWLPPTAGSPRSTHSSTRRRAVRSSGREGALNDPDGRG